MRGSIKQRYPGSYSLILDLGPIKDPVTGKVKRRQKWITFRGTRRAAETRLGELVQQANGGQFVEPSKQTVAEWLTEWLAALKKRLGRDIRASTVEIYTRQIEKHIAPSPLGRMRLQRVRPMDVENYFNSLSLATKTLDVQRCVLGQAFKDAKRNGRVSGDNPVKESRRTKAPADRPSPQRTPSAWTATEAQKFLEAAKAAGTQPAALYSLALDSGARKGELLGLRWSDVDLDAGTITIRQQLLNNVPETFGPTKTGKERVVDLDAETVRLLSVHRKAQARIGGLVFTRDDGSAIRLRTIGAWDYPHIIKAAGVRPIRFHDMRHTTATLLLQAGEQVHVVSARLGHAKPTITMNIYAHVLREQQTKAGRTIGALIHGGK